MALFHFTVTQTKRSKGQSAIASAAYRSGEKLYSEYYGEYSDYTRKRGVICSDILLPPHAPKEYADRQTLWNAVEKAERGKNAQLAYSFEISLQNEFSLEENIALAREFLFREFVSRGMTVDVSFHEKECEDGGTPNPHFHFLCPIRPMEQDGTWGIKQRREYVLDEEGNRMGLASGQFLTSISNDMSCPLHPTVGTTPTVGFLPTKARALCTSWQGWTPAICWISSPARALSMKKPPLRL